MKRVKFWVDAEELVVELPENYTEEEIWEEFQAWFDGTVSAGWYFTEE